MTRQVKTYRKDCMMDSVDLANGRSKHGMAKRRRAEYDQERSARKEARAGHEHDNCAFCNNGK